MNVLRATAFALGLYVCLAATVVHRQSTHWAGLEVPWGVVLAVGASYLIAVAAESIVLHGTVWFMLGWATGLGLPMLAPGASFLIAQDLTGIAFMLAGVGSLAVAAVRASRLVR